MNCLTNTILILFLLISSTVFAQQPSIYGKLDTLEIYFVSLTATHGPEGSKYYINGEQVRKIIYDDKKKLSDNLGKCRPCYLVYLDLDNNPVFKAVSFTDCFVGSWIEYHKNGRIKCIGQYKENPTGDWSNIVERGFCGVRVGEWKYFDMNGKLIKVERYNDGVLVQ